MTVFLVGAAIALWFIAIPATLGGAFHCYVYSKQYAGLKATLLGLAFFILLSGVVSAALTVGHHAQAVRTTTQSATEVQHD